MVIYGDYVIRIWITYKMVEYVFVNYVVKKPNTKSKVWQNFGITVSEDGKIIDREKDILPICT